MIRESRKLEITSEEGLCDEEASEDCGVSIGPGQTMVILMPLVHTESDSNLKFSIAKEN
jgi:hypothetical protein